MANALQLPRDVDDAPDSIADPDAAPIRLALRPRDAAVALGLSERALWSLTADKSSGIPFLKIGTATLYPIEPLRAWLAERAAVHAKGSRR